MLPESNLCPMRLNWGCGSWVEPGWVNSDLKEGEGVVVADIRKGLPFDSESFDYVVSIHALPDLGYAELLPALEELRRIVKPGGTLRLGLPDQGRLSRGAARWLRRDQERVSGYRVSRQPKAGELLRRGAEVESP